MIRGYEEKRRRREDESTRVRAKKTREEEEEEGNCSLQTVYEGRRVKSQTKAAVELQLKIMQDTEACVLTWGARGKRRREKS